MVFIINAPIVGIASTMLEGIKKPLPASRPLQFDCSSLCLVVRTSS